MSVVSQVVHITAMAHSGIFGGARLCLVGVESIDLGDQAPPREEKKSPSRHQLDRASVRSRRCDRRGTYSTSH